MTVDYKLANVILDIDDHAREHPELYYRAAEGAVRYDRDAAALVLTGDADFLTYINGLSACKWHRYTGLAEVQLRLTLAGRGLVQVLGVAAGADGAQAVEARPVDAEDPQELAIRIDLTRFDLVGFKLMPAAGSKLRLLNGAYVAHVRKEAINPVRLALCTTTFNNERYILPNIELVKTGVAAEGEPMSSRFHMFVVDNGRTLDADALSDETVTVLPNPNAGGSGGFARGMMAATEVPGAYTHVLIMDDDVRIMPESLLRTYNLLALAQGRYRDAFINGAMLSLEDPTRQYEDVAYVSEKATYRRVKPDFHVDQLADIVENERVDVEVPNAYGAWWYSCIPVSAIEKNGLPMPFFIWCDDVEFGMRNHPVYMTMNGIGVWHASFEGRFRPSVDAYQYQRNFLAMIALDDCASERMCVMRLERDIRLYLRCLYYNAADLLLDGLEDYLKGPEYLAQLDGAALMKKHGALNEKMVPVEELDQDVLHAAGVTPQVLADASFEITRFRPPFENVLSLLPYDKHYLPDGLLKKRPGYAVMNGLCTLAGTKTAARTLVVLDPTRKMGAIRTMDRARFRAIRAREKELLQRYRAQGAEVRRAWKAAKAHLSSRAFWTRYLGLDADE